MVKAIARETMVWAQPELLGLLRYIDGIDQLWPLHEGEVAVEYDVDVEVMELPYVFRTTLSSVPASIPYLTVDRPWRAPVARKPEVGIVWRVSNGEQFRSIPTAALAPLFTWTDVRWHILQQGEAVNELPRHIGVRSSVDDIVELARRLCGLDLLVTVDSFPAHLAGALGVPTWLLLPRDANWRWLRDRDTCPWYPTMRLVRQARPDDWASVIEHLVSALNAHFAKPTRFHSANSRELARFP